MGVGYPVDLMVCVALGVDMFDCVYPARTARFGTALVKTGLLKVKSSAMAKDFRPLDPGCECTVCQNFTRAYIHSLTVCALSSMTQKAGSIKRSINSAGFLKHALFGNFILLFSPKMVLPELSLLRCTTSPT
mmetsp:Transcript_36976/g.147516  ORF Transcript_36976/g.147516 Transcript_36976/m.147516 type:complete len:132 (-) Transcript_36976:421-816(-)